LQLFSGRLPEIRRISDAINSLGKHAILYGDRGVGKTSLATILKDFFTDHPSIRIGKANCERNDTFPSVWEKVLREIPILREGGSGTVESTLDKWLDLNQYVGPGQIRRVLQQANHMIPELVIVLDEFDRLGREWQAMFADTIKDLADNMVSATVVLVGVARNVSELIADHASVSRNLAQIEMPPMTKMEVRGILDKGLDRLDMKMTADAADTIVILAQGFPHFAHLLCKESALSAINERRLQINSADVNRAVAEAVKDNSYNITDEHHRATLAQRKGTLFEQILLSAALAQVDDLGYFASTDVKPVLNAITGKQYEIYGFSQHLNRFSSEADRGPAFEKRGSKRCYRYRFINPLLRPYAILKGMADGLVTSAMLRTLANPPSKATKKKAARAPRVMPRPKQSDERGLFD
jgi:Cdc6-like AAA superfamily ATPase